MTSIQMPQLGETIVEGTILKWLKQEGEHVDRDEPLFEISTDKVDTEVPSPVAGTVGKILVAEGETVPVGTELATVDDGTATAASPTAPTAAAEPPSSAAGTAPAAAPVAAPAAPVAAPAAPVAAPAAPVAAPAAPVAAPAAPVAAPTAPAVSATGAVPDRGPRSQILSPVVRRLAAEHGIDLATVAGTGDGGRITRKDVEAAIAAGGAPPATSPATVGTGAPAPALAPAPTISRPAGAGEDVAPMSHIRKAIAGHMLASAQTTARAWTMVEVNVEHLVRLRAQAKEKFQQRYGVNLTYLPFVIRATADALHEYPSVNARLDGENVVTPGAVHMAIAVSYDAGLIVPVIRDADAMNTVGLARAVADLATRARAHKLQPDEVQGGTFTITNPGPYGSIASVPIINLPQTGILSLDAIVKRPVVIDDAIAIRHMVNISMSWDHRVIDGELATRFLARVKQNLEGWDFAEDLGL